MALLQITQRHAEKTISVGSTVVRTSHGADKHFASNIFFQQLQKNVIFNIHSWVGIAQSGETRFFTTVQTGPGAHPISYAMSTGKITGVKLPWLCVDNPTHQAPRLKKH